MLGPGELWNKKSFELFIKITFQIVQILYIIVFKKNPY